MKTVVLILMLPLMYNISFAQDKTGAEKLVNEGVSYHDKGNYEAAISKYNKALEIDKDNLFALVEKAFSLLSLEKYDDAIICCQKAISSHPGNENLKTLYVTYGTAYDKLKKTDKSIEIYDDGIKLFPDYYQLYFNKGVSLASVKKYDEALLCFQKTVTLNPKHASSHNAIARISSINNKRIPALLAYCRFLSIEPQSKRAIENLSGMQKIMNGNVEETGKKSVTIKISSDMFGDTTADGRPGENSFKSTDLILSMDAALDFEKKNKNKTEVEQFIRKFETVCASLKETREGNYGFFWEYYVPYFIEMKEKNFIETFAYIAFASGDDQNTIKWLKAHKSNTDKFFEWSASFEWKTN